MANNFTGIDNPWEQELARLRQPYKWSPTTPTPGLLDETFRSPGDLSKGPDDPGLGGQLMKGLFAALNVVGGAVYATATEFAEGIGLAEEDDRGWGETYSDALTEGEGFADLLYRVTGIDEDEANGWQKFLIEGAGLGGDIFLDPTTYMTFGGGAVLKGAAKQGASAFGKKVAAELGEEGLVRTAVKHIDDLYGKEIGDQAREIAFKQGRAGLDDYISKLSPPPTRNIDEFADDVGEQLLKMDTESFAVDRIAGRTIDARGTGRSGLVYRVLQTELGDDISEATLTKLFKETDASITGGFTFFGKKLTSGTGWSGSAFDGVVTKHLKVRSTVGRVFKNFMGRNGEQWSDYITKLSRDVAGRTGDDLVTTIVNRSHRDAVLGLGGLEAASSNAMRFGRKLAEQTDNLFDTIVGLQTKLGQQGFSETEIKQVIGAALRTKPVSMAEPTLDEVYEAAEQVLLGSRRGALTDEQASTLRELTDTAHALRKEDKRLMEANGVEEFRWDFENRVITPEYRDWLERQGRPTSRYDYTKERTGAFTTKRATLDRSTGELREVQDDWSVDRVNDWFRQNNPGFDGDVFVSDPLTALRVRTQTSISHMQSKEFVRNLEARGIIARGAVSGGFTDYEMDEFLQRLDDFGNMDGFVPTPDVLREVLGASVRPAVARELLGSRTTRYKNLGELLSAAEGRGIDVDIQKLLAGTDDEVVAESEKLASVFNDLYDKSDRFGLALDEIVAAQAEYAARTRGLAEEFDELAATMSADVQNFVAALRPTNLDENVQQVLRLSMSGLAEERDAAARIMFDTVIAPLVSKSTVLSNVENEMLDGMVDMVVPRLSYMLGEGGARRSVSDLIDDSSMIEIRKKAREVLSGEGTADDFVDVVERSLRGDVTRMQLDGLSKLRSDIESILKQKELVGKTRTRMLDSGTRAVVARDGAVLPRAFMTSSEKAAFFTTDEIESAINRMYTFNQKEPNAFMDVYDSLMSIFKVGATVFQVGVGFEIRNAIGALANNIAGGVRTKYLATAKPIAAALRKSAIELRPGGEGHKLLADAARLGKKEFREAKEKFYNDLLEAEGVTLESLGVAGKVTDATGKQYESVGQLFVRLQDDGLFETRTFDAMSMDAERSMYRVRASDERMSAKDAILEQRRTDALMGRGPVDFGKDVSGAQKLLYRTRNNRVMRPEAGNSAVESVALAKMNLNNYVEQTARMAAVFEGLARSGDVDFSIQMSKTIHFDYSDLSEFERDKMKRVLPFYTWMRRNTAFQMQTFLSRPAKFQNSMDIHEAFTALLIDPEANQSGTPEWMQSRFGFLGSAVGGTGTRFGWRMESPKMDFYNLMTLNAAAESVGSVSPVLKTGATLVEGLGVDLGIDYGPTAGKSFTEYDFSDALTALGNVAPTIKQVGDDLVINIGLDRNTVLADEDETYGGYRGITLLSKLGLPVSPINEKQQERQIARGKADRTREALRFLESKGHSVNSKSVRDRRRAEELLRHYGYPGY